MKIKRFLLDDRQIEKDGYIWNMIGSMIMAFQSVLLLMILTRTNGLVEAGILTIAYANANLFLTIGKYGVRTFQVSDIKGQFNFAEYRMTRIITSVAMMIVSTSYILFSTIHGGYTKEKSYVIFWMCIFRMIDAIEDVYHGQYQRKNRLDIASKAMTLRVAITTAVFGVGLIIIKNLLLTLIVSTLLTTVLFVVFTQWTYEPFRAVGENIKKENLSLLLKSCFPLFAGTFLSFYIGNAPKYAIDATLTDELQACYGFISMPVFVIGLLNGFIFNPMLYRMSVLWNNGKKKLFVIKVILQTSIVGGITIVCIAGAYLIGIPILSILYNTDLAPYKTELLILLLGGGFLGLSGLLNAVITIIRCQKSLVWGYMMVSVIAYLFSNHIVGQYGMMGAAMVYTCLMGGLCVIFVILIMVHLPNHSITSNE